MKSYLKIEKKTCRKFNRLVLVGKYRKTERFQCYVIISIVKKNNNLYTCNFVLQKKKNTPPA